MKDRDAAVSERERERESTVEVIVQIRFYPYYTQEFPK
jgi:hypothetical protein